MGWLLDVSAGTCPSLRSLGRAVAMSGRVHRKSRTVTGAALVG